MCPKVFPIGQRSGSKPQQDSKAASTITKHAGRAFGAIALANLAVRNGLLMWALDELVPPDCTIRLQDALAALPLCELYSINQIDLEKSIEALAEVKPAPANPQSEEATLSEVALAAKRLLDGLKTYQPPNKENLWEEAVTKGIPLVVPRKSPWALARNFLFTRKRKREPELAEYGGSEV